MGWNERRWDDEKGEGRHAGVTLVASVSGVSLATVIGCPILSCPVHGPTLGPGASLSQGPNRRRSRRLRLLASALQFPAAGDCGHALLISIRFILPVTIIR